MSGAPLVATERRVAASPVWVRLTDTFTGRAPTGPLTVTLERLTAAGWVEVRLPYRLTAGGDLAFVNLGRTTDPGAMGAFDVRVTVTRPGSITETAAGTAALVTTITSWAPDAPVVPSTPDGVRLFPGPAYDFPARIPLLGGRVVDPAGDPVERARVWVDETVQSSLLRTEEVRTDAGGWFRLPVRWSDGPTDVRASRGALSGVTTVSLPAALSSLQQITLT